MRYNIIYLENRGKTRKCPVRKKSQGHFSVFSFQVLRLCTMPSNESILKVMKICTLHIQKYRIVFLFCVQCARCGRWQKFYADLSIFKPSQNEQSRTSVY